MSLLLERLELSLSNRAIVKNVTLNVDPGERMACVALLNWFFLKSLPPTRALIKPVLGSMETIAPSISLAL